MAAGPSVRAREFSITHKTVLHLAVPMTLAYLTTPFLGLVDTAVVGRFGNAALIGGLAVGAILIDLVYTTFNFLRSGTTGLVSQAFGADDEKEMQAILFRALVIAITSAAVVIVLGPLLLSLGLYLMAPGKEVADATRTYFFIRILSTPFALGNYAILGWLLGIGKSGTTLAVQALLNGVNIIFSIMLGLWFGWGITGVAVATIIGEVTAFLVGCALCWRMLDKNVRPSRERIMQRNAWRRLANLNGDIMIRSFSLFFAFAYFTAQGASFGEVTLAANAILMHFFLMSGYFLDGLATAAEQIVGRSIGARYREGFWRGFRLTFFWSSVMAILCTAGFWLAGPSLIELMTTSETVRNEAMVYLAWAVFIPLAGIFAFHLDGVFIGATWSRDMSLMMILSLAVYLLVWWLVKTPLGNHGLWLALYSFLIFRGITLAFRLNPRVRSTFRNT